jgi:predicted DCC family thiol-disulfide oxidoreductase YuxK
MRRLWGRLVVLIDGGCPLCRRTARVLHAFDWLHRLAFADATDETARERWAPGLNEAALLHDMHVVDGTGAHHAGYDGYLRIAVVVPVLWPFAVAGRLPGIRQAGRAAYQFIAARRERHGRCTDDVCAALPGMSRPSPAASRGPGQE